MSWWNDPLIHKYPQNPSTSSTPPSTSWQAVPSSSASLLTSKKSTPDHVMVDPIFDFQFRIILIGDSTVGKSSLLRSFTDGTFAEISDPTVGVDFFARIVEVKDRTNIKLQLWDTAGQERFRSITKAYYRNSVGAVLAYDVCNRETFTHIGTWMSEAKRQIEPHKAVFILVGCKTDLADSEENESREVSEEEAKAFADFHEIHFIETSAKTRDNVEEAFTLLAQSIYDKVKSGEYKVEDGWDGIKKGYFGSSNSNSNSLLRRARRRNNSPNELVVGEAAQSKCC